MSTDGSRLLDRIEGYVTRLYYSLNEENFNCLAVISRYYNFRDHRKVLFGINLFMTVISVILAGYTVYLAYLFYDVEQSTVWIAWLGFGAIFVVFASFLYCGHAWGPSCVPRSFTCLFLVYGYLYRAFCPSGACCLYRLL